MFKFTSIEFSHQSLVLCENPFFCQGIIFQHIVSAVPQEEVKTAAASKSKKKYLR